MTLKSRGPVPLYYESLLSPFRVHFVLKVESLVALRILNAHEVSASRAS